jgi:hypothetical protein
MVLISALGLFSLLEGCCHQYCMLIVQASDCRYYCSDEGLADRIRFKDHRDSAARANSSSTSTTPPPIPGELFALSITLGPTLNFKSSNEDYGGGYGEHKPGVGFNIGAGTVLPIDKHWAVAPSLRFTQKNASESLGYSDPGGGGGMDYTNKYSYSYIGAPILAQYRAGKHLSFVAGPEINYLLSASVKSEGSGGNGEKQSITKSSQKLGFDILAGVKYEIPAGNKRSRLGLQLMYDHRLSRLNKKQDENGNDVPAYHMKGFQLGLAYNICGCGKKK